MTLYLSLSQQFISITLPLLKLEKYAADHWFIVVLDDNYQQGMLSDQRSMLVRNLTLAGCTSKLGLQSLILHKRPTVSCKDKMLGDIIESFIGTPHELIVGCVC